MNHKVTRNAFLILLSFLLTAILSIAAINGILKPIASEESVEAKVYQDGKLLHSFRLDQVNESFTLTITATDGGYNTIEVRPGAIGILSADCPDKLCVKQGFLSDSLLPVTCLPHRLVILLEVPDVTE